MRIRCRLLKPSSFSPPGLRAATSRCGALAFVVVGNLAGSSAAAGPPVPQVRLHEVSAVDIAEELVELTVPGAEHAPAVYVTDGQRPIGRFDRTGERFVARLRHPLSAARAWTLEPPAPPTPTRVRRVGPGQATVWLDAPDAAARWWWRIEGQPVVRLDAVFRRDATVLAAVTPLASRVTLEPLTDLDAWPDPLAAAAGLVGSVVAHVSEEDDRRLGWIPDPGGIAAGDPVLLPEDQLTVEVASAADAFVFVELPASAKATVGAPVWFRGERDRRERRWVGRVRATQPELTIALGERDGLRPGDRLSIWRPDGEAVVASVERTARSTAVIVPAGSAEVAAGDRCTPLDPGSAACAGVVAEAAGEVLALRLDGPRSVGSLLVVYGEFGPVAACRVLDEVAGRVLAVAYHRWSGEPISAGARCVGLD